MVKQFIVILLGLGLMFPLVINAQDTTSLTDAASGFPQTWAGQWAGDLEIFTPNGLSQTVPMELHILPIDGTTNYTWTIIYGADKEAGKRPYELQPVDPEKGIYLIDEKNSIKMEAYYYSGKLYSRFEVMGNLLLIAVEKQGEELIYDIISGKLEPVSLTGKEVVEGEEIPEVKTYPIGVRQRAVLNKKEMRGN